MVAAIDEWTDEDEDVWFDTVEDVWSDEIASPAAAETFTGGPVCLLGIMP